MNEPDPLLLAVFLGLGLLLSGLAVPLLRRRVPPNRWYGFRVPKTLGSPAVWYPANAHAGWGLLWVGVAVTLTALGGYFGRLADGPYAVLVAAVSSLGLLVVVARSFAFLSKLPDRDAGA